MEQSNISILTNRGKALEAASAAGGDPVVLAEFVVGDGNGQPVTPDAGQTALVREVYRGTISRLAVSPEQENQFIAYLSLPEGVGGFVIREVGLLTNNNELYAAGSCAAIEKPEKGVTATLEFRMAVSESAQITLQTATGEGLFLRQDMNLADVVDKDEAVNNFGLRETVNKARNALPSDGTAVAAEKLATPRNINGVPFDGTRDINITSGIQESTANQRYVTGVRLGAVKSYSPAGNWYTWTQNLGSGNVMTGIIVQDTGSNSADNIGGIYYRPLQYCINGTWVSASSI
ncbi:hypothetical protein FQJ51_23770 [Escherichia coli]|nr:hypothetical protein [Escherichia coli]